MSSFINSRLLEPARRTAHRFHSTSDTPSNTQSPAAPAPAGASPQTSHAEERNIPTTSIPTTTEVPARIPAIARANGFQGTIPLDDIRSTYVFDESPVLSPGEMDGSADGPLAALPTERSRLNRTIDSIGAMSIDEGGPTMSRNPSLHTFSQQDATSSIHSGRSGNSGNTQDRRQEDIMEEDPIIRDDVPSIMSGKLPEDDGMKSLRQQLQQIRNMALSAEEKAKAMHDLMTKDYQAFKATAEHNEQERAMLASLAVQEHDRHRSPSPGTISTLYNLQSDDLHPTYRPATPPIDSSDVHEIEEKSILGCKHYMRNIKVQCNDCKKWYTCRHCHDQAEKHSLIRKEIRNMLCMLCSTPQPAAEYCRRCNEQTAVYYCDICKLWDNDSRRRIYHCEDCGICRVGEGLGKDFVHCKKCNVCINIAAADTHRCVERATECDCPICGDWMFTSAISVVAMKCGHYMHRDCYDAHMQTSYKCPICNRSAVNMELQWRKLDRHIEMQPMPSQFTHTKAWISCNDCSARTVTTYHWLGNKCTVCGSYNTTEIKLVDTPAEHEARAAEEAQRLRMASQVNVLAPQAAAGMIEPTAIVAPAEAAGHSLSSSTHQELMDSPEPSPYTLLGGEVYNSPDLLSPEVQPSPAPLNTPPRSPPRGRRPIINSTQQHHYGASNNTASAIPSDDDTNMTGNNLAEDEVDDVEFWGSRISSPLPTLPTLTTGWNMRRVSMPTMPSMPSMPYMPTLANMPTMPNMPSMSSMRGMQMPTMPQMPQMPSMPQIPSMQMPTMPTMPNVRGLSPSGWSVRSLSVGVGSPGMFARKPGPLGQGEQGQRNEDEDEGMEDEDDYEDESEDDEEDEEGDGDGDVDEMALFGHR